VASGKGVFDLSLDTSEGHTAVVDINGTIAADTNANATRIVAGVKAAFENENTAGVILRINSGGGSPVQSGRVFDEVRRLRAEHEGVSIGVRGGGFGFVGAMDKLGVERRLYTSGENKAFLDPFTPTKQNELTHMENLLGNVHEQFKDAVREGRGELTVAREIFAAETLVNFTPRDGLLDQLASGVGASATDRLVNLFTKITIE